MSKPSFKYGTLAVGIFKALLWLTVLVTIVLPKYLVYYILLLLFLGFFLRPLLLMSGLYSVYQELLSRRSDKINQELRGGYYKRNAKEISIRTLRREKMRKALQPKNK